MGEEAFGGTGITEIRIPSKVTMLSDGLFEQSKLEKIYIDGDISYIGGRVFYCSNIKEFEIPSTVQHIDSKQLFYGCRNLRKVTGLSMMKELSFGTFDGCELLEEVIVPNGTIEIPEYTFDNCRNVKEIFIPDGVKRIALWAFGGYNGKVHIPDSVEYIDPLAFDSYGKDMVFVCSEQSYAKQFALSKGIICQTPEQNVTANDPVQQPDIKSETINISQPTPQTTMNINKKDNKKLLIQKINLRAARNKKHIKITWEKLSEIAGYQLQYATNKKFKKAKNKWCKKNTFTLKKVKKKTYYFRVRAYTVQNGKKTYGKWSSIKKVKAKKS